MEVGQLITTQVLNFNSHQITYFQPARALNEPCPRLKGKSFYIVSEKGRFCTQIASGCVLGTEKKRDQNARVSR